MEGQGQIRIKYLNVQSWTTNKHTSLSAHLTLSNPDIILFTSTSRLNEEGPIKIQGYNTFTTNKDDSRHAGSGVAVKSGIDFTIINNFLHDTIGTQINTTHGPIIFMTSYAPPRQQFLPNQDLEFMMRHQYPVLFAGDLNARHRTFGYRRGPNAKGRSLHQHIMHNRINYIGPSFPTFHTLNSETKPDCVLSNNKFFFNHHITSAGIGPSDHITMDIQISVNPISIPCTPIQDEKNTNWEEYKRRLEVLPEINLDGRNILDLHNEFSKLFSDITNAKNASTPIKTFTKKNNLKTTTKFKRLTKILNRYHNALMTNGLTNHLSVAIRNTQLLLIQEGNVCKEEWWQAQLAKVELAAKCNIKFWKRINHLSGRQKAHVPPLKYDLNGTEQTAKTDDEKENLFTNILKQACRISPEENTDYCQNNERRVKEELQS